MDDLNWLLERLPKQMPLGLYECPAPYRRLLTDDELKFCANSGRFVILKDVSCDLETVKRRVALTRGTPLAIVDKRRLSATETKQANIIGANLQGKVAVIFDDMISTASTLVGAAEAAKLVTDAPK